LRQALERIRRDAEDGVRGGCEHVVLSDKAVSAERAPIPMILATAAVHSHLVRQKLRTFCSLNVRAGECLDVHYFAVLVGCGATTVNAYLAQESIADRQARRRSPATRRRSTTACSRSCRRWASRSSRPTAAATTSRP
jgi:glutamate synthase (NADPH/NADH) large chain